MYFILLIVNYIINFKCLRGISLLTISIAKEIHKK